MTLLVQPTLLQESCDNWRRLVADTVFDQR